MAPTPARRSRRDGVLHWTALVATVGLALALWAATFHQLGFTVTAAWSSPVVIGDVVGCGEVPIGPGCTVQYVDAAGRTVTRGIDRPGIVGAETGEQLPLWVAQDGSLSPAGWRPWVDAALLLSLTAFATWTALGRVAGMITRGDTLTEFDLAAEASGEGRYRDVG